jgi:phosphate transport system protein
MTRKSFDRELTALQDEVLALGNRVENALVESVRLLKKRDFQGSRRLIAEDKRINEKRFAIEDAVLGLIATQQPMASDLRILAAILEIITELERMGDYAKGIARINLMIGERPLLKPLVDIPEMAECARGMLHRALEAFVQRDVNLARAIPSDDDRVDELYNQVYQELLVLIIADPAKSEQANLLLWVAHNLERTADRVINLCERVVFAVTGEMTELSSDGLGIEGIN